MFLLFLGFYFSFSSRSRCSGEEEGGHGQKKGITARAALMSAAPNTVNCHICRQADKIWAVVEYLILSASIMPDLALGKKNTSRHFYETVKVAKNMSV